MLRLFRDEAGKHEHDDDVRNGHKRVGDVGYGPHDIGHTDGAHEGRKHVKNLIGLNCALAEEEGDAAVAVVAPAQDGGIAEQHHAQHEHRRADERDARECCACELGTCGDFPGGNRGDHFGVREHRGNEHDAGEGADHDGVPEGAGHGHERLACGVARRCRRGHDGSRAQARFVGEQAACAAELDGRHNAAAKKAAEGRLGVKGALEDERDCLANIVPVHANDGNAAPGIGDSHEGHELLAHAADDLHAAEDDDAHQDDDGEADSPRGNAREVRGDDARHGTRLYGRADAEACHGGEQREEHRADFRPRGGGAVGLFEGAQPSVHRAAEHLALVVFHAVFDRCVGFGVLGGDAEDAGEPHPQNGARAARHDGRGHADDVARADGGRKRRAQRAELRNVAFGIGVFGHRELNRLEELALDEARSKREE